MKIFILNSLTHDEAQDEGTVTDVQAAQLDKYLDVDGIAPAVIHAYWVVEVGEEPALWLLTAGGTTPAQHESVRALVEESRFDELPEPTHQIPS